MKLPSCSRIRIVWGSSTHKNFCLILLPTIFTKEHTNHVTCNIYNYICMKYVILNSIFLSVST